MRDDWGNWFGCDNTHLCWHYPLADHYLRRNPYLLPPPAAVLVPSSANPNRLYPIRTELQLFKLSGPPGQTTAACGLGIYRDELLGEQYHGNAFVCEPVNLLIHRLLLSPHGSTFSGRRAAEEATSEFLAATDNWFRPVQVRTGPDGCLWVVDMYRYVIEHPRWIPPEDLRKLDVRAGSNLGRIYRIRPKDRAPRPIPRLDKLDTAGLVAALDSPNGWQRDMAGQMLRWRSDAAAVKPLEDMVAINPRPEARLQALCVLDGVGKLRSATILGALADKHAGVRRHAVRLSEKFLAQSPELGEALLRLLEDPDAQVRLQVAYSLGAWQDVRAGRALAVLALRHVEDAYLQRSRFEQCPRRQRRGDPLRHLCGRRPKRSSRAIGATAREHGDGLGRQAESAGSPAQNDHAPSWPLRPLAVGRPARPPRYAPTAWTRPRLDRR